MSSVGTMIAVREADGLRFLLCPYSAQNTRTTISMFRNLLEGPVKREAGSPGCGRSILVIQYDDLNHHDICSVAYCRPRGKAPAVQLVPDSYFFLSRGYQMLREAAATKALPPWEERQDIVFWRGSSTTNGTAVDGSRAERIEQIPRVALCRALREHRHADVGIMGAWGFIFPIEEEDAYLKKEQLFRPAVAMPLHAHYRYLIDIDGVAFTHSFFEKLLLGACILKVGSPFEQWFYHELCEWQHFVPVRADLSDLAIQLDWCLEHPRQTREIAEEGQRFALEHTFETARRIALEAIDRSLLILDGSPTSALMGQIGGVAKENKTGSPLGGPAGDFTKI